MIIKIKPVVSIFIVIYIVAIAPLLFSNDLNLVDIVYIILFVIVLFKLR